ncbi:glycosyltransferase [Candidatus Woesearchaeota archaeon]|nr:glycosyltransferase [Candidatus Woesearchaeota archaeon]
MHNKEPSLILTMGTYPPRECGIATFTKDLADSINRKLNSRLKNKIIAMNRNGVNIYNYPKEVLFQINDVDIKDYKKKAEMINQMPNVKIIHIQHEFGIFGGEYGRYLLHFLNKIKKPVIMTFHSVLPDPDEKRKKIVKKLAEKVSCIIVMTEKAVEILRKEYQLKTDIQIIPHGIPHTLFQKNKKEKEKIGYKDKIVLSSFGLLSRGKGYEYVIEALPRVVKRFKNLRYLIVGQTHPVVRNEEGERYRHMLEKKVKELKLEAHVKFYNKYMTLKEIIQYLKASDIYISASLDPDQITSGTLVYAMGVGRAVVSTPFLHAKDIVDAERGCLTRFRDPDSFAESIISILDDPEKKSMMERNAYNYTRSMIWPNVAIAYLKVFNRYERIKDAYEKQFPEIRLDHLERLTDDFGVIQFADRTMPDPKSGYMLDDNSRALVVACMDYSIFGDPYSLALVRKYLNFISHTQTKDGKLYNFVRQNREIDFKDCSEDAYGRTLWALGYLMSLDEIPLALKEKADTIFKSSQKHIKNIHSARGKAFSIIGLHHYIQTKSSKRAARQLNTLAESLAAMYNQNSTNKWKWFERHMTYSNARIPESMFFAYLSTKKKRYLDIAESSMDFLRKKTIEKNSFFPIGQNGWYFDSKERAYYDQQPVEAASMTQALIAAYTATKKAKYKKDALTTFRWFLGKNSLNQMVYDEYTGGCQDGLGESSLNFNQGAESTISYLLARLNLTDFED